MLRAAGGEPFPVLNAAANVGSGILALAQGVKRGREMARVIEGTREGLEALGNVASKARRTLYPEATSSRSSSSSSSSSSRSYRPRSRPARR